MAAVLERAIPSTCPFPTAAHSWTVVDDDIVVLGGRVPDLAGLLEHVARAAALTPDARVLSDLEIDSSAPSAPGALVVIDALGFEPGTDLLNVADRAALLAIVASAADFDEVLVWIVAPEDGPRTALEAAELSRRRVDAIHRAVETDTGLVAHVRVEQRDADLTAGQGPRPPVRRRYAVRIRPV